MSTRNDILAAIASTLVGAGVCAGRVYRSRREQIPATPACIVEPDSETAEEQMLGVMDAELTVVVSVFAHGDTPDASADAELAAIHAALMADLSIGLGDTVQIMPRRQLDWQFEDFDNARVTARYLVRYRTVFGGM